jgi:flagellar biosynthesis protein FlhF
MNTRRFRGKTVTEALRKVREALGPDAVILHQGQRDGVVEILASVDFPEIDVGARRNDEGPAMAAPRAASPMSAVEKQDPAPRAPATHDARSRETSVLLQAGFDAAAISRILEGTDPTRGRGELRARLAAALPVAPRALDATLRIRLVGPPGAGKTSTLIKLAANHALVHGPADIAIVTQDCGRLAGSEQLLLASELLGIPVREAVNAADLRRALADFATKRCLLLDTPGFVGQATGDLGPVAGFDTLLVLPATYQRAVLGRILAVAPVLAASGIVLTHTDGAFGLGEALSACWAAALPIVWVGTGNTLPDGIEPATGELLATLALANVPEHEPEPRMADTEPAQSIAAAARAPRRTIAIV